MKLSVVLPVYNTKECYLREAIESILNQTFTDFEFIIINDGSTDNSVEKVILSYTDNRIRYIKQENQGIARSLNNGFALAQGEYIARMDADDISLPERFAKQIAFLDAHQDISLCGTAITKFRKDKTRVIIYPSEPRILDCLQMTCVAHPTVMLRITDFRKYNLEYNPDYKCEDYELWSRALRYLKFYNISEPLLHYRIHENNLSVQTNIMTESEIRVRENIINFLTENENLRNKLRKKYIERRNIWRTVFSIYNVPGKKMLKILGISITLRRF